MTNAEDVYITVLYSRIRLAVTTKPLLLIGDEKDAEATPLPPHCAEECNEKGKKPPKENKYNNLQNF